MFTIIIELRSFSAFFELNILVSNNEAVWFGTDDLQFKLQIAYSLYILLDPDQMLSFRNLQSKVYATSGE